MKIKYILVVLLFSALLGCGSHEFKPDTFSQEDLAIQKVGSEQEIVRYGMSQAEAEKVLGPGEEGGLRIMSYEHGVSVFYREGRVVMITLDGDSKGVYQTRRGAEVEMSAHELKAMYGSKNAIEYSDTNLDYIYDSEEDIYLNDSALDSSGNRDKLQKLYMLSIIFSDNDEALRILLLDRRVAVMLE